MENFKERTRYQVAVLNKGMRGTINFKELLSLTKKIDRAWWPVVIATNWPTFYLMCSWSVFSQRHTTVTDLGWSSTFFRTQWPILGVQEGSPMTSPEVRARISPDVLAISHCWQPPWMVTFVQPCYWLPLSFIIACTWCVRGIQVSTWSGSGSSEPFILLKII